MEHQLPIVGDRWASAGQTEENAGVPPGSDLEIAVYFCRAVR